MKRFLTILLFLLLFNNAALATEPTGVKFIYINGSNNNTEKTKDWFYNGVYKMHPSIRSAFNNSQFMNEKFLYDGKYYVAEEPVAFYWGDKSNKEILKINDELTMTKMFSPKIAQTVRSVLAHTLHDAIWVEKYHNMRPILQNLHNEVIKNAKEGNQVVLFGYSAGSFITYQYLFNKLPNIDVADFFNKISDSQEEKDFVAANKMNPTCIDAILDSHLAVFSITDHLIINKDKNAFKKNYMELNSYTQNACIPKNSVRGIVNFASPLVLFYSDLADPKFELTYYNRLLYEYMIENGMFWLTVNYSDDPLGFPTTRNLTSEQIEQIANLDIEPHIGFIYDKSNIKSERTFIGAHTSYWSTSKKFSKAVVDAYEEGYNLYYSNNAK